MKPSKVNITERSTAVNYFSEQGGDGTPSVADGDTSLGEGGYGADAAMRGVGDAAPYRSATAPMGDVQVVERASQLTAEGKRKATAADFDGILQELGEVETAVVVKRTAGNRYNVHRVLTPDGSVLNFAQNAKEAEPTPAGEWSQSDSLATPIGSASANSITKAGENVNNKVLSDVQVVERALQLTAEGI